MITVKNLNVAIYNDKLNIDDFKYCKLSDVKYIKEIIDEGIICENILREINDEIKLIDYKKIRFMDLQNIVGYIAGIINEIISIRSLSKAEDIVVKYKERKQPREQIIKAIFIRFKKFHLSL